MAGRKNPIKVGDEVEEYLKLKSQSTAEIYRTGFRKFITYYRGKYGDEVGFNHFLDRLYENLRLPMREQKRVAELEMVDYLNYLKGQGGSNNTQRLYFGAIQNYLKYRGIVISAKWVGNYPKATPKKENKKHQWTLSHVKEFVEKADTFREKAIILLLFQSGISISDLRELDYGDISYELEKGQLPLLLDLSRFKTGVSHKTFIGSDAVMYLKTYLKTRGDLKPSSPLFVVERQRGKTTRITDGAIQKKFKAIAEDLSFLKDNGDGYNPARPHSMRSAFRSRLTGKMDGNLIEFFMGHTLPGSKMLYINLPEEELREMYTDFEKYLSIETTSKEVLEGRPQGEQAYLSDEYISRLSELEQKNQTLKNWIDEISREMEKTKAKNEGYEERAKGLEERLDNMGKKLEKLEKQLMIKT
jgi:integrase/recombinase XerD